MRIQGGGNAGLLELQMGASLDVGLEELSPWSRVCGPPESARLGDRQIAELGAVDHETDDSHSGPYHGVLHSTFQADALCATLGFVDGVAALSLVDNAVGKGLAHTRLRVCESVPRWFPPDDTSGLRVCGLSIESDWNHDGEWSDASYPEIGACSAAIFLSCGGTNGHGVSTNATSYPVCAAIDEASCSSSQMSKAAATSGAVNAECGLVCCSGHGQCSVDDGGTCQCDSGYESTAMVSKRQGWVLAVSTGASCERVCAGAGGTCVGGRWNVTGPDSMRSALESAGLDPAQVCSSGYHEASISNHPPITTSGGMCYHSRIGEEQNDCRGIGRGSFRRLCWCENVEVEMPMAACSVRQPDLG